MGRIGNEALTECLSLYHLIEFNNQEVKILLGN